MAAVMIGHFMSIISASSPDLDRIISLCDEVNAIGKSGALELADHIKLNLRSSNPRTVWLTLVVLDACVKNCGKLFHKAINHQEFMHELKQIVYKRWVNRKHTNYGLDQWKNMAGEKAVRMVQHWGTSFASRRDVPWFYETYRRLLEKGVRFPPPDEDTRTPIDTPAKAPGVLRSSLKSTRSAPVSSDVAKAVKDANDSMQLLKEMAESGATPDLLQDIVSELQKNMKTLRQLVDPNLDKEKPLAAILGAIDKAEALIQQCGFAQPADQEAKEDGSEESDEINEEDLLRRMEASPQVVATAHSAHQPKPVQLSPAIPPSSPNPFDFWEANTPASPSSQPALRPQVSNPMLATPATLPSVPSQPAMTSLPWESFSGNAAGNNGSIAPQPLTPAVSTGSSVAQTAATFGKYWDNSSQAQPQQMPQPQPQMQSAPTIYGQQPSFYSQQPMQQPMMQQPMMQQPMQQHYGIQQQPYMMQPQFNPFQQQQQVYHQMQGQQQMPAMQYQQYNMQPNGTGQTVSAVQSAQPHPGGASQNPFW